MAPHSSILAWKIPWTEETGRLQSTGLQRVGYNLAINNNMKTYARNRYRIVLGTRKKKRRKVRLF